MHCEIRQKNIRENNKVKRNDHSLYFCFFCEMDGEVKNKQKNKQISDSNFHSI